MSFFALPDRQVIYLLDYLRTGLNGHKYVKQWFDTSDEPVSTCFAFDPKKPVVYKDDYMWKIYSTQFPALGIWRNQNNPERDRTFVGTRAACGIGWFAHIPAGGDEHEPDTWGRTFASNIWHVCKELLENVPSETREKGGFEGVWIGAGDCAVDMTDTLCGFIAPLTVQHLQPPYAIDDLDTLIQIAVDIKLYDSATIGLDGIQGKYEGLTVEAEIEP